MYFFDIQVPEYYKPPSSAPPPSRSGDGNRGRKELPEIRWCQNNRKKFRKKIWHKNLKKKFREEKANSEKIFLGGFVGESFGFFLFLGDFWDFSACCISQIWSTVFLPVKYNIRATSKCNDLLINSQLTDFTHT